jgi:hypothetical protein
MPVTASPAVAGDDNIVKSKVRTAKPADARLAI